jgi:hypothetical protein
MALSGTTGFRLRNITNDLSSECERMCLLYIAQIAQYNKAGDLLRPSLQNFVMCPDVSSRKFLDFNKGIMLFNH